MRKIAESPWTPIVVVLAGVVAWVLIARSLDDPTETPAPVIEPEVSIEAVDATEIEMHGYDEEGNPGLFVYDCHHDGGRLICTQRAGATAAPSQP